MTENEQNERNDDVPGLGPDSDAEHQSSAPPGAEAEYCTHVRRDKLMLARPMDALPKIWLYVYKT